MREASTPGSDGWPMDWPHRLMYWAYGAALMALALAGAPLGFAIWAVLAIVLPVSYMGRYLTRNWTVVLCRDGLALERDRGAHRWVAWPDVLAVRRWGGVPGGKLMYHIQYRGGAVCMMDSAAAGTIVYEAELALRQRQLLHVVQGKREAEPSTPSASALSRVAIGPAPAPCRALSLTKEPGVEQRDGDE